MNAVSPGEAKVSQFQLPKQLTETPAGEAVDKNDEQIGRGAALGRRVRILTNDNGAATGLSLKVNLKPHAQTAAHRVCRSQGSPDEPGRPPGVRLQR